MIERPQGAGKPLREAAQTVRTEGGFTTAKVLKKQPALQPLLAKAGGFQTVQLQAVRRLDVQRNIHGSFTEAVSVEEQLKRLAPEIQALQTTAAADAQPRTKQVEQMQRTLADARTAVLDELALYRAAYEFWLFRNDALRKRQLASLAHELAEWDDELRRKKTAYDKAYAEYHQQATGSNMRPSPETSGPAQDSDDALTKERQALTEVVAKLIGTQLEENRASFIDAAYTVMLLERETARLEDEQKDLSTFPLLSPSERGKYIEQLQAKERDLLERQKELAAAIDLAQFQLLERLHAFSRAAELGSTAKAAQQQQPAAD